MPQLIPYTLELQFNSAAIIIGIAVVGLASYVLPLLAKLLIARTHVAI